MGVQHKPGSPTTPDHENFVQPIAVPKLQQTCIMPVHMPKTPKRRKTNPLAILEQKCYALPVKPLRLRQRMGVAFCVTLVAVVLVMLTVVLVVTFNV